MMASPEWYYEEKLKGKSPGLIEREIRRLEKEIRRLKKILEDPNYPEREWLTCPSEDVQLSCMEAYLDRAKIALTEAGG